MIRLIASSIAVGLVALSLLTFERHRSTPDSTFSLSVNARPNTIASHPDFMDFSDTEPGRLAVADATDKFRGIGAGIDPERSYRAYRYRIDPKLTIVAPESFILEGVELAFDQEGRVTIGVGSQATPDVATPDEMDQPLLVSTFANLSMQWNLVGDLCLSASYSTFGRFDTCWHIYKLVNESDGTKDYYAYRHFGTAMPTASGSVLTDAWLESWKHTNGPSMAWVDWNPGADVTSGCQSVTVSVSALGIGLSTSAYTRCETWDITKGVAGGSFKNDWNGTVQADRQVIYQTAVSVAQGANPIWGLWFSHTTCKMTWTWQCSTVGP